MSAFLLGAVQVAKWDTRSIWLRVADAEVKKGSRALFFGCRLWWEPYFRITNALCSMLLLVPVISQCHYSILIYLLAACFHPPGQSCVLNFHLLCLWVLPILVWQLLRILRIKYGMLTQLLRVYAFLASFSFNETNYGLWGHDIALAVSCLVGQANHSTTART